MCVLEALRPARPEVCFSADHRAVSISHAEDLKIACSSKRAHVQIWVWTKIPRCGDCEVQTERLGASQGQVTVIDADGADVVVMDRSIGDQDSGDIASKTQTIAGLEI
jgi:hypothetical protein